MELSYAEPKRGNLQTEPVDSIQAGIDRALDLLIHGQAGYGDRPLARVYDGPVMVACIEASRNRIEFRIQKANADGVAKWGGWFTTGNSCRSKDQANRQAR